MIRSCDLQDIEVIHQIINDGARAYKGTIPAHRWREPYMSMSELQQEMAQGVAFWGYEENGGLVGVMGLQKVRDVTLIRHAYVRTSARRRGIGADLLHHLRELTSEPMLIGTWEDAIWAINFYKKNGFRLVSRPDKCGLLRRYWNVPERQIETSVVLADVRWWQASKEI
jgi:GNAT superfamily N-acetyltransferase